MNGVKVRNIAYTLTLGYSIGPKYSPSTERQVRMCSFVVVRIFKFRFYFSYFSSLKTFNVITKEQNVQCKRNKCLSKTGVDNLLSQRGQYEF